MHDPEVVKAWLQVHTGSLLPTWDSGQMYISGTWTNTLYLVFCNSISAVPHVEATPSSLPSPPKQRRVLNA